MSGDAKTWTMIHAERNALATTLEGLTPDQWEAESLCAGWTVRFLAAHVLAGAEQTQGRFVRGMVSTGFSFNKLMERDARRRVTLGLTATVADDAANACLQMYTKASFPVGGRKRIGGLRLVATDTGWSYGAGPDVSGGAMSLLLAMTGRAAGIDGLTGDGVATLSQRIATRAR